MQRLAARLTILGAIVLLLSGVLLCADPFSDVEVAGAKLEYLAGHAADYDTIFVGSSYVFREFSPAVFDRETAAAGLQTHSFNLGVPGMDPPETYYVIDRLLAMQPPNLRYVVVELDYFRATVRPRNVHTRRFDYWHDSVRTAESVRGSLEFRAGWRKGVKDSGTHSAAFLRRFFNLGRGRAIAERLIGVASAGDAAALGPDGDGFLALDDDPGQLTGLRRDFFEAFEEDRYDEKLAQLKRGDVADDERGTGVGRIDLDALQRTIERIERVGARPILIIPPCLATRADLVRMLVHGVHTDVLAFNDPDAFPELYEPRYRFDVGHLNREGAELFSAMVARRFVENVRRRAHE